MISMGIDVGSTNTKGILFDGTQIIKSVIISTGTDVKKTASFVKEKLLVGRTERVYTVATGYGRDMVDFADKKVTEITCHGKGAHFFHCDIAGVIDIGGQDSKAICLDKHGNITDFIMNDKCAAGTGKFIEMMMRTLGEDINTIDNFLKKGTAVKISSMCTVFAESEIISLLAADEKPENIALGVVESICQRTVNLSGKLNMKGTIFFSGGIARSQMIKQIMAKYLNQSIISNRYCQMNGAVGAAVIGHNNILESKY